MSKPGLTGFRLALDFRWLWNVKMRSRGWGNAAAAAVGDAQRGRDGLGGVRCDLNEDI